MKQPDEAHLMDYLYGELPADEQREVEAYLAANPDLAQELLEMQEVRQMMQQLPDTTAPPLPPVAAPFRPVPQKGWKVSVGIAAALALLILFGYLINLRLAWDNRQLTIAFGQTPQHQFLTADQVATLVDKRLAEQRAQWESELAGHQQQVSQQLEQLGKAQRAQIRQFVRMERANAAEVLRGYVAQLAEDQRSDLRKTLQAQQALQTAYADQLIKDFGQYLQQHWQEDMAQVASRIQELEQSTSLSQQETQILLSSLLDAVSQNPEKNQYE